ncbi:MAG: regulatory iron-sulfur-containing complex subunit RicT [Planctomycetota bacterium]|nr:regulatory iron-sulfur-containing complex subunit RicT [Planctomycetota bacterium]
MRIAEVSSVPLGSVGCSSDPNERCGHGLEKIYPTAVVRYGYLKHIGEFTYKPGMKFTCGGQVVIQTDRGIEIGNQVSLTCTGCSKSISRDQMQAYAKNSGETYLDFKRGKILREASTDDLHEERRIRTQVKEKLERCNILVAQHNLPMKTVECEHVFGGERIIFYFMADNRVDFRQLVRDLAQEYHTRIEMRQVGARDEARLLADYETCGQECCCKTFLKTLKPISMRMAKMQKATLDPSKVSGRCGRLKCCLRYEHDTYESLDKKLPKIGRSIRTAHGEGIVVDRQILTQLVQIEMDDSKRITVVAEDILPPEGEIEDATPKPPKPPTPPEKKEEPALTAQQETDEAPAKKRRRRRKRSRRSKRKAERESQDTPKE